MAILRAMVAAAAVAIAQGGGSCRATPGLAFHATCLQVHPAQINTEVVFLIFNACACPAHIYLEFAGGCPPSFSTNLRAYGLGESHMIVHLPIALDMHTPHSHPRPNSSLCFNLKTTARVLPKFWGVERRCGRDDHGRVALRRPGGGLVPGHVPARRPQQWSVCQLHARDPGGRSREPANLGEHHLWRRDVADHMVRALRPLRPLCVPCVHCVPRTPNHRLIRYAQILLVFFWACVRPILLVGDGGGPIPRLGRSTRRPGSGKRRSLRATRAARPPPFSTSAPAAPPRLSSSATSTQPPPAPRAAAPPLP